MRAGGDVSSRKTHPIVLGDMGIAAMRPIRQGHPDRVNHHTPYPVAKGVRDSFAQDVVGAIHIRIDATPVGGLEQPALDTLDTLASIDLLLADGFQIAEAAQGSVALLAHNDA